MNGSRVVEAAVRQADARLGEHPLLAEVLPHVGHFVTRNRGTVCGSIAHADAAAELPLALVAVEGSVVAASNRGQREIPADDFFLGPYTTSLEPDELVVETHWPEAARGTGTAFEELAHRGGDYALAMAAARVRRRRVARGGRVGRRPADRPRGRTRSIPGSRQRRRSSRGASIHASPGYLKALVRVLVDRAVVRARETASS